MSNVKERGEVVSARKWREALSCGDFLDRLPCQRCGGASLSACTLTLSKSEIDDTRDYVNGYGWAAARQLSEQSA